MSQQTATMFSKQTFVKGCYCVLSWFVACIWKHPGCDWPTIIHIFLLLAVWYSLWTYMTVCSKNCLQICPFKGYLKTIIIEVLSNVNFVRMFQNQQHGFSPLLHSVYSNEMGMFNIQCIILNRATWQNTFLANFFHVEMSIKTNQTRSHVLSLFQNHHFLSGINALCVVKFIICLCIFSTCCCLCWDSNLK